MAEHSSPKAAPNSPMIEWRRTDKRFGSNHVLRGIDLQVARGESCVVIGGSGTGKSVLLKTALGLLKPDGGEILIDGQRVDHLSEAARFPLMNRMGVLFQGGALFDSLRVWENVAFRKLRGAGRKALAEAKEAAIEKLRRVGLGPDAAERYPAELSGGMQKRAALARAMMADPEILFVDEPTAGLDPIMSGVINHLIREIVTESGATAVTITHDLSTLRTVADKVAMLHQGKIIWQGPVAEADTDPNPCLRQFLAGRAEGPIEAVR